MGARQKRIVLIGPVYPYKGGISHYTGSMYLALSKEYEVTMISYSVQYIKLIYKKEQKDYSNDILKIDDTHYWIHTMNPVNWFRVARQIRKIAPDLVIIQWWHPYFAPCYCVLTRLLGKQKVLFVCHNVFPHERFPLDKMLTKITLKRGNCFIVHSATDAEDLCSILPNPWYEQTVIPTYEVFRSGRVSREEARKDFVSDKEEKVLLFFGFVREYKGLHYLLNAMPLIRASVARIKLLIVGDFGSEENKKRYVDIIAENGIGECIEIYDGYIPDGEIEKYFMASDLVVCPYISATQSGIVQLAYEFEKPVVVTGVGGLPDVVTDGRTGYVVKAEDAQALAEAVIRFFRENKGDIFRENIQKEAERFGWNKMSKIIGGFLDENKGQEN